MVNKWIFIVGFFELCAALIMYAIVIRMQLKQFKNRSSLQPLKRLLLTSVLVLMFASVPLMVVYADAVWFDYQAKWIIPFAVLGNATAKVVVGAMLILIYKFRSNDDNDIF